MKKGTNMDFKRPKKDTIKTGNRKKDFGFEFTDTSAKPEFPVNVFPKEIQLIINGMFEKSNFEKPMIGAGILYAIAVIAGNRVTIPISGSWNDNPNLWIAIVGQTGTIKTPAMKFTKTPIDFLEKRLGEEFSIETTSFREEVASWEATARDKRGVKPMKPGEKHYITMDTTTEGLIHALKFNPFGISIYRDELSGFFRDMNRYSGGGGDETFYLSAWGNDSHYKIRKVDDGTRLEKVTVSIFGGVQPKILHEIALSATDNGMIYRYLYVESDNIIRDFSTDGDIDIEKETYLKFFTEVFDFIGNKPFYLNWDNESTKKLFAVYINEMNVLMRSDDTSEHMRAYIRKLQTYLGRFTAIMCVMYKTHTITEQMLQRAAMLVEYFMATGRSTFDGLENEKNIKAIFNKYKAVSKKAKIIAILNELPQMKNAHIANATKADKGQVSRVRKEFEKSKVDKSTS